MNNLTVFKNQDFGEVRTETIDDDPYFVEKDVAEILAYERGTKAIADRVEAEDRIKIDNETLGTKRGGFCKMSDTIEHDCFANRSSKINSACIRIICL